MFIFIVVAVYRLWLRQYLTIRWRQWLTHVYFRNWLADRSYYRMELVNHGTDNPEQRIEQDINSFTTQTLTIGLGLLSEIMTLVTFTYVLWSLSGSLTLGFLGGLEVPGYMVWVALLYAILGSWATWAIGRRLVRVNFDLERYNADFRYRMTRIRENAESIALYDGEPDEARRLSGSFRPDLRPVLAVHAAEQAAELAERVLWPGRRHLPDRGAGAALLRRRDHAGRADPDRRRVRAGAGLAVLVRRFLHDRWRTGRRWSTG